MSIENLIVDFDNPKTRAGLFGSLTILRGKHRVTVLKYRPRRSDRQNAWYWPCFVHVLGEYQRSQGENDTDDDVHEFFKLKFLRRPIIDRKTGEVIGQTTRSTTTLTTVEFNDYLDRCALWLWEKVGIIVPEPNVYHEREDA